MRIETGDDGVVVLTLSRRNLRALLSKLDWPESARTLVSPDRDFIVRAEEDDVHYAGRTPGPMHPRTEAEIA